jgi:hypothetical protein
MFEIGLYAYTLFRISLVHNRTKNIFQIKILSKYKIAWEIINKNNINNIIIETYNLIKIVNYKIGVWLYGGVNERLTNCVEMALDFFESKNCIKSLNLIIDIYDEIRYSEIDNKKAKQKFLGVLYNLKKSDSLHSLLGRDDKEVLSLFLNEFLGIRCNGENCYIANESFSTLALDELYNVLITIKYLKEEEMISENQLSV